MVPLGPVAIDALERTAQNDIEYLARHDRGTLYGEDRAANDRRKPGCCPHADRRQAIRLG